MTECTHNACESYVRVMKVSTDSVNILGFCAQVQIRCSLCKVPFQFLGLETGVDTQGARMTADGIEAMLAVTPLGILPDPATRMQAKEVIKEVITAPKLLNS